MMWGERKSYLYHCGVIIFEHFQLNIKYKLSKWVLKNTKVDKYGKNINEKKYLVNENRIETQPDSQKTQPNN